MASTLTEQFSLLASTFFGLFSFTASKFSNMFTSITSDEDLSFKILNTFLDLLPIVALLALVIAAMKFLQWCIEKYRFGGLSADELKKLRKIKGSQTVQSYCSICQSDIEADNEVQLLPGCYHGFHSHCISTWLSRTPTCPLCRCNVRDRVSDKDSPKFQADFLC